MSETVVPAANFNEVLNWIKANPQENAGKFLKDFYHNTEWYFSFTEEQFKEIMDVAFPFMTSMDNFANIHLCRFFNFVGWKYFKDLPQKLRHSYNFAKNFFVWHTLYEPPEADFILEGYLFDKDCTEKIRLFDYLNPKLLEDRDFVFWLISKFLRGIPLYPYLPKELKNDSDVLSYLAKRIPEDFQYFDEGYRDDESLALAAISRSPGMIVYASKRLQNNIAFIVTLIKENSSIMSNKIFKEVALNVLGNDVIACLSPNSFKKATEDDDSNSSMTQTPVEVPIKVSASQRIRRPKRISF